MYQKYDIYGEEVKTERNNKKNIAWEKENQEKKRNNQTNKKTNKQ